MNEIKENEIKDNEIKEIQNENNLYTENDSDNESDFEIKYEISNDNFQDVSSISSLQKPIYI